MMTANYTPGELVNIEIKGAKVLDYSTAPYEYELLVEIQAGNERCHTVQFLTTAGITVERVTPPEWSPQPGDVWDNGPETRQWMVIGDENGVQLDSADGVHSCYSPEQFLAAGPPRLLYRQGWQPTPDEEPGQEAEPAEVDTSRAGHIAGYRALIDRMEQNPQIPQPDRLYHYIEENTDAAGRAAITAIAEALGVKVTGWLPGGNLHATAHFGPVEYDVIYVSEKVSAEGERRRAKAGESDG